ncbi:MAG: histidine kinase dimerization/phosphoacceptor domain -containing protein [Caulobacter sp.]|nr:histidine kinase dimerization/phosphoacceptor domain -containing protein [Caulobacter sp.]
MTGATPDLTDCDREPIHIPGSIQPHGVMIVAEPTTLRVTHVAGDAATLLGLADWQGKMLGDILGGALAERLVALSRPGGGAAFLGHVEGPDVTLDASGHRSGDHLIIELEPVSVTTPTIMLMGEVEATAARFERTPTLEALCDLAAVEFRRITGFDRVMIYRFLAGGAGAVLAEDKAEHLVSFLNHHFPGSDIPQQARALYVRNLIRTIPDISYAAAPLAPAWQDADPLDMSDCVLRSVSPIHLQYLKNMGVAASASISIVRDGVLWGLIACHHDTPRHLPYDIRAACRSLAASLARQIRAKEEGQAYRERLLLRSLEDELVGAFERHGPNPDALAKDIGDLKRLLAANGVAVVTAEGIKTAGDCPTKPQIRALAAWAQARDAPLTTTSELASEFEPAAEFQALASGLIALVMSSTEPFVILWFRAEEVEVVNWAGNPHKAVVGKPGESLTPRTSFEAWRETVRGRARPWSLPEIETAGRLRAALLGVRQNQKLRELNHQLADSIKDKETLLEQKEVLLREANHRVQNSLQLVSSFLGLQARSLEDARLRAPLDEARRRLHAVGLVHRRLYRADQIETIELARYIEELISDILETMGPEWAQQLSLDLSPVSIPTDRAVILGLILTELVINTNKYAYGGAPGQLSVTLEQHLSSFRLIVADQGAGKPGAHEGFGTRMVTAMVQQLSGVLEQFDNQPGLRTVLTAPVEGRQTNR